MAFSITFNMETVEDPGCPLLPFPTYAIPSVRGYLKTSKRKCSSQPLEKYGRFLPRKTSGGSAWRGFAASRMDRGFDAAKQLQADPQLGQPLHKQTLNLNPFGRSLLHSSKGSEIHRAMGLVIILRKSKL